MTRCRLVLTDQATVAVFPQHDLADVVLAEIIFHLKLTRTLDTTGYIRIADGQLQPVSKTNAKLEMGTPVRRSWKSI
jgi:hypothetical protein